MSFEVHVLASGSDGNCTVVCAGDTVIMIDAGLSGKKLVAQMDRVGVDPKDLDAILLTHEHQDHVRGAGVISRRFKVPVHANNATLMNSKLGKVERKETFSSLKPFTIKEVSVQPLRTSHRAAEPNAYALEYGGRCFLMATDTGTVTWSIQEWLPRADLVVIESNYDPEMLESGPYPFFLKQWIRSDEGHLSNNDCARALKETSRPHRKVFLGHLSKNNNMPEVAVRTVAEKASIPERQLDCLECLGDCRSLRV